MSEPNRPVTISPELIDIEDDMPQNGSIVLAIGLGGKLCEVVWTSASSEFFVAWMSYPKIPPKVKEKLMRQYQREEEYV